MNTAHRDTFTNEEVLSWIPMFHHYLNKLEVKYRQQQDLRETILQIKYNQAFKRYWWQ